MVSPTASLSVHVVLAPDDNIVVTTVTADPPGMKVAVTSWALSLDSKICHRGSCGGTSPTCHPTDDPSVPGCLDGRVSAGVSGNNTVWSLRQPLGNSSSKPISVAMASVVTGATSHQSHTSGTTATRIVQTGTGSFQVTTAVISNLDLCHGHEAPGSVCDIDPVNASLSTAASASAASASLVAANHMFLSLIHI